MFCINQQEEIMINRILFFFLSMTLLSLVSHADNQQKTAKIKQQKTGVEEKTQKESKHKNAIKYNNLPVISPPKSSKPAGGTRASKLKRRVKLFLLVPSHLKKQSSIQYDRHTGQTSSPQPTLYWYISNPTLQSFKFIEFKLKSTQSEEPILITQLPFSKHSYFQKLDLAGFNISLKPNQLYSWSVALVKDPTMRYDDYADSATIKYLKVNQIMQKKLNQSNTNSAHIYAESGFWYEAISTILQQLEEQPNDTLAKKDLVALMKQVGLDQVVENY